VVPLVPLVLVVVLLVPLVPLVPVVVLFVPLVPVVVPLVLLMPLVLVVVPLVLLMPLVLVVVPLVLLVPLVLVVVPLVPLVLIVLLVLVVEQVPHVTGHLTPAGGCLMETEGATLLQILSASVGSDLRMSCNRLQMLYTIFPVFFCLRKNLSLTNSSHDPLGHVPHVIGQTSLAGLVPLIDDLVLLQFFCCCFSLCLAS